MPNQAYRLRIRSADDLSNTLVITSIRGGTNPYISGVPSGDGQEVDLLTGAVRTGAYNVEVVDAVIGTDSTGTLRIVTQNLYDGVEEYLLLENGDKILLENGDPIELEANNVPFIDGWLFEKGSGTKADVVTEITGDADIGIYALGRLMFCRKRDFALIDAAATGPDALAVVYTSPL